MLDIAGLGYVVLNLVNARNILRSPSWTLTHTPSRSPSPDPEWEAIKAKTRRKDEKRYRDLIARGGRLAYPPEVQWACPDAYGKYADIFKFWSHSPSCVGTELGEWICF
jgi:hypothetical protein